MRYRFVNVRVDGARQQVWVDGSEVACQPRVYQLLLMLCEAGGSVVTREAVFARLWKDQTYISDESLTQVVHRLRGMLGATGAAVRTVRGVGFRLDSAVVGEDDAPPSGKGAAAGGGPAGDLGEGAAVGGAASSEMRESLSEAGVQAALASGHAAAAAAAAADPKLQRHHWRWWAAAGIAALALLAAAWLLLWRPAQVIDSRFALQRRDLEGSQAQTVDVVTRALAAERLGDRAQARHLLETVAAADPSAPLPPALRAMFGHWQEDRSDTIAWAMQAEKRLSPNASPYLRLMVHYVRAQALGRDADWLAAASAILTLRPEAWYMRLARAHYRLAHREEAPALADLEQIPVRALNDLSLALVLADRASLGDIAGAQRDLDRGVLDGGGRQAALVWYVRGRLARSRHRPAEARDDFDREIAAALRQNQPDLITDARILGAVCAVEAGDLGSAATRFDQAVLDARNDQRADEVAETLGLGAYLAWRRGDSAGRDRRLAEAAVQAAYPTAPYRAAVALLAMWTGAGRELAGDVTALAAAMPEAEEVAGVDELLLARHALAAGDRREAARRLQRARSGGVDRTFFREDAELLGADLGEAPQRPWIDPPYPNALRYAAVWELNRRPQSAAAVPPLGRKP